jgi:hypothetical protein
LAFIAIPRKPQFFVAILDGIATDDDGILASILIEAKRGAMALTDTEVPRPSQKKRHTSLLMRRECTYW